MLIANQKRKENIAEYLLYMFQVEDAVRAYGFDIIQIEKNIVNRYDQPYSVRRDIREWYSSLITIMQAKNLNKKGHIPIIQSLIYELESLHSELLEDAKEYQYQKTYSAAKLSIEALRIRSEVKTTGDIQLCLNGLYGLLMLRLSGRKISPETSRAFESISELVAILSAKFRKRENEQDQ